MMTSTQMIMCLTYHQMRSNIERKGGENMGYKVCIQRTEEINFETFEEAEEKMKELYAEYGNCPSKYSMVNDKHTERYDCENGKLIKANRGY